MDQARVSGPCGAEKVELLTQHGTMCPEGWEDLRAYASVMRCRYVKVIGGRVMVPYYGDEEPGPRDFFDVFHSFEQYSVHRLEYKGQGSIYVIRGKNKGSQEIASKRRIFYAEPDITHGGM